MRMNALGKGGGGGLGIKLRLFALIIGRRDTSYVVWFFSLSADEMLTDFISRLLTS